ncbi:hypothetical protein [Pseudomonas eucalypticola]|uniref:Uncharacterized protein n=1 Tax=Pseudomonas eucalypticola TaxID=2599595 RepID=A0A7D5H6A8_9PSED|nr:hypothetical protein [Pseudomonas eucalypticola]QKZ04164.1 hypothetical protein HWQ56_10360 [Pseudomonas eucalypticola]
MTIATLKAGLIGVLLVSGACLALLSIAWLAIHSLNVWPEWPTIPRALSGYLACWRVLLYSLISAGWWRAFRMQRSTEGRRRLQCLALIGFSAIVLAELTRL